MGRLARAGAGAMVLLAGAGVVLVLLLVNGGFVYKTSCPLASGGMQTSWTYAINDIVPYIRHTSAPCSSHSGTRLLLSTLGIWPLHRASQTQIADVIGSSAAADPSSPDTAGAILDDVYRLRAVTDQWTYLNDAVGVVNDALRKTIPYKTGEALISSGVPPLLSEAIAKEPSFEHRLHDIAVTTAFGRGLRGLEVQAFHTETQVAVRALRSFQQAPKYPWTAAKIFGDGMDNEGKSLSSEILSLFSTVPASARAQIQKAFLG